MSDSTTINPSQSVNAHGVILQDNVFSNLDLQVEEIRRIGFTVIENAINPSDVMYFRDAIDTCYAQQIEELGGEEVAAQIDDAQNIRCPLSIDPRFLELAVNEHIQNIFKKLLGENFVLMMQNAIINKPETFQHQTFWHRDLNYQHWTSSTPMVVNALFCIDDFTLENGCTVALPGSQFVPTFPSKEFILKHEHPITAPAGSVIVMDSMVYHRTGHNMSKDVRRAVNNVIGLPFMAQQLDLPTILNGKYANDAFLNKYLGYRWQPAKSAKTWREARLKKG